MSEVNHDSLNQKFGRSAATTFLVLRRHHVPLIIALATARAQVAELGINYPGGFGCAAFRRVRSERDLFAATGGALALA